MVHLDEPEGAHVWFAADAMRLASKMPFDHFWPMPTPLNFKRRCNPRTVADVVWRLWPRFGRPLDTNRLI